MIKHIGDEFKQFLINFGSKIYETNKIPIEWKQSNIFSIPKPVEWNYNLGNTRPIILLECLRKMYIKILTIRLGNICVNHSVLKGLNFAGLQENSINVPIHV